MFSYLEILRPVNCLMTVFAVLIGGIIVAGSDISFLISAPIWFAMLAGFLITGAGNSINDYIDIEADKINKPDRPIPSGRISSRSALIYTILLFTVGIIFAGMVNYIVFIIALVNSVILILYSKSLQNKLLVGNFAISYLVASGFIFGGAVPSPNLINLIAPGLLALLAFFASLSREIIKDIEDFEGDRQSFLKKMAKKVKEAIAERIGLESGELKFKKHLKILSVISLIIAIIISPLPYILNLFSINYLFVVWITDVIFLWVIVSIIKAKSSIQYRKSGKRIKLGMLFGLLAFLVGALI